MPRLFFLAGAMLASAAFAQSPTLVQQASASGAGLASLVVTLPQLPLPGHLLVVCHDSTSSSNSRVQGGGVTTWQLCASSLPNQDNSEIWAGVVDAAPAASITLTLGSQPNSAHAIATEWRGCALPLQFTAGTTNGFGGTAASPVTTASVSANARDLVIATTGVHSTGNTISAPTNSFVDLTRAPPVSSSVMAASYRVMNTGGIVATSWSLSSPTFWATAIAVFAAAPPPVLVQQVALASRKGASFDVSLPSQPAPGSVLVVCHESSTRNNSSVTGGGVTAWTLCASSLPAKDNVEIWAGVVGNAPAGPVRITLGGGTTGSATANVSEWRGFLAMPAFTGTTAHGTDGSATSPASTGILPAADGDLVVAALRAGSSDVSIGPATNGFTGLDRAAHQKLGAMAAAVLVPGQPGPVSTCWTLGARTTWASAMVVFRLP